MSKILQSNLSPLNMFFPPAPTLLMQQQLAVSTRATESEVEEDLAALESILTNLQSCSSTSANSLTSQTVEPARSSTSTTSRKPTVRRQPAMRRRKANEMEAEKQSASSSQIQSSSTSKLQPTAESAATSLAPTNTCATWSSTANLLNITTYLDHIFDLKISNELHTMLEPTMNESDIQVHLLIYKQYLSLSALDYLMLNNLDYIQPSLNDVCAVCVEILKASSLIQYIK